jgi:hypothetical protein
MPHNGHPIGRSPIAVKASLVRPAPHRRRHNCSARGRHRLDRVRGHLLAGATAGRHVDCGQRLLCTQSYQSSLDVFGWLATSGKVKSATSWDGGHARAVLTAPTMSHVGTTRKWRALSTALENHIGTLRFCGQLRRDFQAVATARDLARENVAPSRL